MKTFMLGGNKDDAAVSRVRLGILLSVVLSIAPSTNAAMYYASPSGGGNGLSQGSPFKVASFWPLAQPGDTLNLLDGLYQGSDSMIRVPETGFAGTAANPITIRAMNDGAVTINGQFTRPVNTRGSYGILEGINVKNGDNTNVSVRGDHWIVRRVASWDVGPATIGWMGDHNFDVGGTYNLLEDIAAFGRARKQVAAGTGNQGDGNNTVRRAWARWEANYNTSGPSMAFEMGYGQDNVLFENVIGTQDTMGRVTEAQGIVQLFRTQDSQWLGSIFYLDGHESFDGGGLFTAETDGGSQYQQGDYHPTSNTLLKHIVSYKSPNISNQVPAIRLRRQSYGTGPEATNVQMVDSVGVSSVANQVTSPPWSTTNLRYGTTVANAIGAGNSIFDEVPGIRYRYVNGVLQDGAGGTTAQPLWPWPMNQRIINALTGAGYTGQDVVDVTATMESIFGPIPPPPPPPGGLHQVNQNFGTNPQWEGFNNQANNQNFGYLASPSNKAGGAAAGEMGGQVDRGPVAAWYATSVGEIDPSSDPLTATGKFAIDRINSSTSMNGRVNFGWFDKDYSQSAVLPRDFIGFYADGSGLSGGYANVFAQVLANGYASSSALIGQLKTLTNPGGSGLTSPQAFSLTYDPTANGGNGRLTFGLGSYSPVTINLSAGAKDAMATLDRFGLIAKNDQPGTDPVRRMMVYIDDLNYTSANPEPSTALLLGWGAALMLLTGKARTRGRRS